MSLVKNVKSSKKTTKKDDKDIVVSFHSDTDDDDKSLTSVSYDSKSEDETPGNSHAATKVDLSIGKLSATTAMIPDPTKQEEKKGTYPSSACTRNPESDDYNEANGKAKVASKPIIGDDCRDAEKPIKLDEIQSPVKQSKTIKKKSAKSEFSEANGDIQALVSTKDVDSQLTDVSSDATKESVKTSKKGSKGSDKLSYDNSEQQIANQKTLLEEGSTTVKKVDQSVSEQTQNVSSENGTKRIKKTTKKSAKAAQITADGEIQKTSTDEVVDKVSDKKSSKKAKVTTDKNVVANEDKLQSNSFDNKNEREKETEPLSDKVKQTKKQVSVSVIELEKEVKAEKAAENSEDILNNSANKIIPKKKTKKASCVDASAITSDPVNISALDTGEQLPNVQNKADIDADREVQSICDAKDIEKVNELASGAASSEEISTVVEVSVAVPDVKNNELAFTEELHASNKLFRQIGDQEQTSKLNTEILPDGFIVVDQADTVNNSESSYSAAIPDATDTMVMTAKNFSKEYLSVSDKKLVQSEDVGSNESSLRENEESDYTYRRKSMDDFIKRILAEAREEQQKKLNSLQPASENNSSSPAIEIKDDRDHTVDNQPTAIANDQSMLDRRLASTDRKRIQMNSPAIENPEISHKTELGADLDLDDDLAQIKGYFSRRSWNSTNKSDAMNGAVDDAVNNESSVRGRIARIGANNDENFEINQKVFKDVLSENGSSALSRLKQQQVSETLGDDEFTPKRREETSDVVRSSIRPVRAVIDHQTDVVQQLKTTSRGIDELENEIRSLRETFLDRQARIESLRSAIDAECRMYTAEQTAANDRIQQQKLPGGRFVRDDFIASLSSRLTAGGEIVFRPRSGSVSNASGLCFGSLTGGGSSVDILSPTRASSVKPGTASSDIQRRQFGDADDDTSATASGYSTGRLRRGGSVAPERMLTNDEFQAGSGGGAAFFWTSRTSSDTTASLAGGISPRSLQSSSYLQENDRRHQTGSSYSSGSYYRHHNPADSLSTYSSNLFPTLNSGRSTSRLGAGLDRTYAYDSASPSSSISTSYSSPSINSVDPSKFRRAQSVFDVGSESTSSSLNNYNSIVSIPSGSYNGNADSAGDFQSRFLDKIRGKKAYVDDSRSGSGQFKSRFLRSSYDSNSKKY